MDPIIMPQIGENIATGTVVRWHKQVGEPVARGEVVLTVESEKASFDVEADRAGVLVKALYREGEQASVFSPVGYIGEPGEMPAGEGPGREAPGGEAPAAGQPAAGQAPVQQASDAGAGPRVSARPYASPSARRVASERGVSLEGIPGSGPGGRIVKKDVLAAPGRAGEAAPGRAGEAAAVGRPAAAAAAGTPPAGAGPGDTVIPLEGVRRIAAERLSLSSRTIPHFHVFQDVDMGAALAFREELNHREGAHVSVTDLVAHAAVGALKAVPGLNAHVDDTHITLKGRVHLGIAVASDRGLVVPVVARADGMGLRALAEAIGKAVAAARKGRLDLAERGTFTVSSLGMFGVPAFLPLIDPPECAILGVGAVEERVSARGGWIAVRPIMTVVLGCDHRAVDGAEAARFLGQLKERLENGPGVDGA